MELDLKKIIIFGIILLLIIVGVYFLFFNKNTESIEVKKSLDHNFLDYNLNNKCGQKNKDTIVDVNLNNKAMKLICTNAFTQDYSWQDYEVYTKYVDANSTDNNQTTVLKNKLDYEIFEGKSCLITELGSSKKNTENQTFVCKEDLLGETGYSWKIIQSQESNVNELEKLGGSHCTRLEEFNTKINEEGLEVICLRNLEGGGYSWQLINNPEQQQTPEINQKIAGQSCEIFEENRTDIDLITGKEIRCVLEGDGFRWVEIN